MPKYQGIQYQIEGMNIVFTHEDQEVTLPIKMGQGAYHVMNAYFDKLQRKTTDVKQLRETKPGSNEALRAIEIVVLHIAEHYEIKQSHINLLKSTLKMRMHADIEQDMTIMVSRLKAEKFICLKDRDNVIASLSYVHDLHIKYKRIAEPKSVIIPANPMSMWYLPSQMI